MPVKVKKVGKKYRVIESSTGKIAKNASGTAIDGGGHASKSGATRQVNAVNLRELRKKGRKGLPRAPKK